MPFLRRRGNQASENDMRRHTLFAPTASNDAPPPLPTQPELADDDGEAISHERTRESTISRPDTRPGSRPSSRPDTPPIQEENARHRRFSVLRFRNASDSQLSLRAKQQAEKPPPVPRPPEIITTAPTNDFTGPKKKPSRMSLAAKFRRSTDIPRDEIGPNRPMGKRTLRKSFADDRSRPSLATLEEPESPRPSTQATMTSPNGTVLTPPGNRPSESSRSDASSNDRLSYGSPNSTPKKATTPFFKLRRGKKPPEPLFPLAHLQQKSRLPPGISSSSSLGVAPAPRPASANSGGNPATLGRGDHSQRSHQSPATTLFAPGGSHSGQSSPTRANLLRGRSSTMSSMGRDSTDDHLMPPTTRTSSSTGRKSFGDLFGLSRLRQNSELSRQGTLTPTTPGSIGSKNNSLQIARDSITLPERRDDESPAKYLARVEEVASRGIIAAVLSKSADPFMTSVLRSYMRSFAFFGDPMDMAIRKLLMEAELPKETQQIDRCLQAFANRYHECNPGIYASPDQAYFIAFSLLILHTDVFNKNNKYKMQKTDYLKNTRGEGIYDDILECFYDNISYTPFIHVEDDLELDRFASHKSRRKPLLAAAAAVDPAKRAVKEPIDPYTLIIDGNLDVLRPNLKDTMHTEDHYTYLGTAPSLNLKDLQKTFFRTGVLQIVSARSRPDAFMTEKTAINPEDAHPGIVDIKVTKVGLLWRKDVKKRKTRSPWQEWGAILTGAQLYFFRNVSWVKNLIHQYENHVKAGNDGIPLIFNPPLEEFKPDGLMSTQGAVALMDLTYKKHKNAFVYVRQGGLEEVLLADNEEELNDWLAKLNYAAAFRTTGVRMRGVLGANYDGQGRRGMRRLDSSDATQLVQTPTGPVSIARGLIDHKMAEDISAARRDGMHKKIAEAEEKLEETHKQLDDQLRNARHLQILAPIQPRTREQLLLAAARLSAQVKWTRMEIWKEKCHRDILVQDFEEEHPHSVTTSTPTRQQTGRQSEDRASSPTPRPNTTRRESKSTQHSGIETTPRTPTEPYLIHIQNRPESAGDLDSPLDQVFQTPPQSATRRRHSSRDLTHSRSELGSIRHGSISSIAASPVMSVVPTSQTKPIISQDEGGKMPSTRTTHSDHDDLDADERNFLEQAGLLESRSSRDPADKATTSTAADVAEQGVSFDKDKIDRSKIRRSLQRTLRESAGHLSHHRSRKGKEIVPAGTGDEAGGDVILARGTGSFVVHGKKASVINFGNELQTMSQDEKIRARKQSQQIDPPLSPMLSGGEEDDFPSAVGEPLEMSERRESAASASTATARSFRDLHRKYSSAQAARSASTGGRLTIPSDGESEVAVSFSDGRRSPLPPIETETDEELYDSSNEIERDDQKGEQESRDSDDESFQDLERLPSSHVQAVNA
ncbi:Fc.00g006050.m01.CDS01 [Cosmosporella sp. VM-42]